MGLLSDALESFVNLATAIAALIALHIAAHGPDTVMLGAASLLVDAFLRTPPVAQA